MTPRTPTASRLFSLETLESRLLLTTYYVNGASGADANPGTADAAAFKTLQKAANTVAAGDVVVVRPGTYAGFRRMNAPGGTAASPIRFSADPGVVVNSFGPGETNALINIENTNAADGYYVIEGFEVNASNRNRGIRSALSRHNVIRNNVVHGADDSNIFASRSDFVTVEGNVCYAAAGQHGIYVNGSDAYVIRGNECYGNNWDGIHTNVSDGVNQVNSNGLIEANVVHDNMLAGMDLTGINNALIRNNLAYGNGRHGVVLQNSNANPTIACHDVTLVNNTFDARDGSSAWAIQISAVSAQPGGTGVTGNDQGVTLFNNVLIGNTASGSGAVGDLSGTISPTFRSDYNVVADAFRTGGTQRTLAAWRTATGQDANSVPGSATGLFANPAAGDYRLKAGAVALNAGVTSFNGQAAPADDFEGQARPTSGPVDAGYDQVSGGGVVTPDTTPPAISNVTAGSLLGTGATITWATDEAADTQVEYGTTAAYGSSTTRLTARATAHSQALGGLSPSTTYHYRVRSADAAGNVSTSADFTFTTPAPPPDTTAPVISAINASGLTTAGATVSWTTDEASDSQIEYGTTTAYGSSTTLASAPVTSHGQTLGGLSAGTVYHYRVKSRDAAGNLATSADRTFTTVAPPDTTAPVISGVAASSVSATGATVSWSTNEAADTQVEYGTDTTYGSLSTLAAAKVTSHGVGLGGLSATTTYHYRVLSRDAAGNLATSADFTFTTSDVVDTTAPVISGIVESSVTTSGVTIAWTTDEAATTQIQYGTTTAYGSTTTLDALLSTVHSQSLTGLTANTLYHYRVRSRDAAGNLANSVDGTFTTAAVAPTDTTAPAAAASLSATETGVDSYTFTVIYSDNVSINEASIDGGDVLVTGPGGYSQLATRVGVTGSGASRGATYSVPAPGGSWSWDDNGYYTVALVGSQVRDNAGNWAAGADLGGFDCAIDALGAFGLVNGRTSRFTFTDADGTIITATLSGGGTAEAYLDGDEVGLDLTGTTARSSLNLVARRGTGDSRIKLGDVKVHGMLRGLMAPAGDLSGTFSADGPVGSYTFGRVMSGAALNALSSKVTFVDSDGTLVSAAVAGGGVVEAVLNGDRVDLEVSGTGFRSSLLVLARPRTGDSRVSLGDVKVQGTLRGMVAPAADLKGTMVVAGSLGLATLGSIDGGTLAAAGNILGVSVRGGVTNGKILAGLNLGADDAPGGGDDLAAPAVIGRISVLGAVTGSVFAAGVAPGTGGVFGNTNDTLAGGSSSRILSFAVSTHGTVDDATVFEAGLFGKVQIGKTRVDPTTDPRFHTLT